MKYIPEVKGLKVSYCGLVCEYCIAYRKGACPGCDAHVDSCEFIKCLKSKGEDNCLACDGFPCRLHREGFEWPTEEFGVLRWRVFSKEFLDFFDRM